jgi:hypothetical protein
MACRIKNTGKHTLSIDLAGGATLYLKPGETSRALREELLYHNVYVSGWLKQGLAQWIDIPMSEVHAEEQGGARRPEPAAEAASPPKKRRKDGGGGKK